ncbi:MAG TPA: ribonuclease Z [Candidatus Woesearchaeota archaeon]|nr:ribonuclease Z [Candidatus Woesearchaeota archaeon]
MIEIAFLGTSSMFPTKKRSQSSVHLKFCSENMLFDCGEGTQRQLRIMGISPMKIDNIFVTHWHGDHTLGLAGLIQSMSASRREKDLYIYGPIGTSQRIYHILHSFAFKLTFKIQAVELQIKEKTVHRIVDKELFAVEAMPVSHITPCISYTFIEKGRRRIKTEYLKEKIGITRHKKLGDLQKGKSVTINGVKLSPKQATFMTPEKKIAYIVDTSYFKELEKIAENADLLICESTYLDDSEVKAEEYFHLTAKKAATIAKNAKAKQLILTHFSQRYKSLKPLEEEAKKIFKEVKIARDFDKIEI